MSKADDDGRNTGSHQADRAGSGKRATTGSDEPVQAGRGRAPGVGDDASRPSRRAADGPVDAVPETGRERDSQARARNREALRAYRALAESQPPVSDDGARIETPTRRQLRVQQAHPGAGRPVGDAADGRTGSSVARPSRDPVPGGRRDRREQHTLQTAAVASETDQAAEPSGFAVAEPAGVRRPVEDMSVEEALAARQALTEDARDHSAAVDAGGVDDPFSVDLEVLAQQKALAERAAVLTSRARRMQELSEQNQQRKPEWSDPASAHNLSIVTPPEFVRVPGGTQTVLRAPTTTHIPLVLPKPAQSPATPAVSQADIEPIQARSAFGLEPLDAMTAGLGRVRRVRYLQYSMLVVGAAALSTGIIMTVSSLNG